MLLETQKFAVASIIKQWELFTKTGIIAGHLTSHAQHKKALMNHLSPYMDSTFDKLKGREAYNSFVGALQNAELVTKELVREIYTPEEAMHLEDMGQSVDDIHVVDGLKPLPGF
jgi:hypothetical protein